MSVSVRFVYGFEYEEHADDFLAKAGAAGYIASLDERDDGIEAVSIIGNSGDEADLGSLAEQSFGHSLGARSASG